MSKGEKTREKILAKAVSLASITGLEDLTIGKLAKATKLSKSGLFAHFNSKKNLQEQVVKTVAELFMEEVMNPAIREPRGIPRIRAIFRNWKEWIDGGSVPGGCLTIEYATMALYSSENNICINVSSQYFRWTSLAISKL